MKAELFILKPTLLISALVLFVSSVLAQTNPVPARVTQAVDMRNIVTLRGNVHPLARPEFDQGTAPDDLPTERILLVLQRGADQEAALRQLLDDQQSKSSPQFHRWLTPEQFGRQFGPTDSDIQAVTDWLTDQGFQVNHVAKGRTVIEFSGTAGMVRQVLGAEIHKFRVNGEDYWANATDPQIPAALAPVVAGFASLNNFPRQLKPAVNAYSRSQATGEVHPLLTLSSNGTNYYAVAPMDFATIYNVLPLWNAGVDGTGQTIAIVSDSNIYLSDPESFRNAFGLPAKDPLIILDGPDPGITDDESAADIDVEWSGAVARNATIDLVVSGTTESTWGIDLSTLYVIDNNLAPVLSVSYGECEQFLGAAGNAFYYATREQGAAQGITIISASGDSGSATCDYSSTEVAAQYGLTVNGLASTPFTVAVGGTDFGDVNTWSQYWNSTNSSSGYESALSYIPETTWNSSCAAGGLASGCASLGTPSPTNINLAGGGGGPSTCGLWNGAGSSAACASGYPKPAWQTGVGVPQDGVRDIPDISLFASPGTNNSFYVFCEWDAIPGYPSCVPPGTWYFVGAGGTSFGAPAFAGIMAMVNEKTGQRQGNANYVLYPLAAQPGASCTSSAAAVGNSNCIFYDIVNGNNSVACVAGSPNCSDQTKTGFGILVNPVDNSTPAWETTTGYDMATGLGSVNAANLVNQWNSVSFNPTTTTLSSFPATITHGQPVSFTVNVTSGSGTPTGDFSLIAQVSSTQTIGMGSFTLGSGGSFTGTTDMLPGGSYNVVAHYAGDGSHGASDSTSQPVTVGKESSLANVQLAWCDYTSDTCTFGLTNLNYGASYGFFLLRANVTNANGQPCASPAAALITYPCPTGTVTVTVNGQAPWDYQNPGGGSSGVYTLNSQGYAEDQYIQIPGGTNQIVASYSGDNGYNASTSTPLSVSITKAPTTTTITNVPQSPLAGTGMTVTVTVTTQSHGLVPSGLVQIYNGTALIGGGGDYTGSNGSATSFASVTAYLSATTPAGTSTLTAQYPGDDRYASSTSPPVTVTALDYALSSNPSSITIPAPGQSATATIIVTSVNGFSNTVYLSTSSSCFTGATCTLSPTSVTVTPTSPGQSTLTITTTASSNTPPSPPGHVRPGFRRIIGPWILAGLLALLVLLSLLKTRRRAVAGLLATGLALAGIWAACGGGGGGGGGGSGSGAVPLVNLSPASINFGQQATGVTSAAQSVTLSNVGTASLSLPSIIVVGNDPGDFAQTNNCGSSLASGASCNINVTFTPTTTGSRTATLMIYDNASGNPHTAGLSGTGITAPVMSLSPTSMAWGYQVIGTPTSPESAMLANPGPLPTTVSSIALSGANPGDFSQTNNCGNSFAVGTDCYIYLTFTPTASGTRSASLVVTDNAGNSPQTISLSGAGISPMIAISPPSLTFGNQYWDTMSSPQTLTLTNISQAPVSLSYPGIGGLNYADFGVETNSCGTTLTVGANCAVAVYFFPHSTGSRNALFALSFTANGLTGTQSAPLSGTCVMMPTPPGTYAIYVQGNISGDTHNLSIPTTVQ
jgi:hypothetical protein